MTEKQNNSLLLDVQEDRPFVREMAKDRHFIDRYLREYRKAYTALHASLYARRLSPDDLNEDTAIRAKMFEIKLFVASLPQCSERLFLYYYYIKGLTMERCAEALDISRRSVYRLKLKALDFALQNYKKQ